jgi:hypothetical protein
VRRRLTTRYTALPILPILRPSGHAACGRAALTKRPQLHSPPWPATDAPEVLDGPRHLTAHRVRAQWRPPARNDRSVTPSNPCRHPLIPLIPSMRHVRPQRVQTWEGWRDRQAPLHHTTAPPHDIGRRIPPHVWLPCRAIRVSFMAASATSVSECCWSQHAAAV